MSLLEEAEKIKFEKVDRQKRKNSSALDITQKWQQNGIKIQLITKGVWELKQGNESSYRVLLNISSPGKGSQNGYFLLSEAISHLDTALTVRFLKHAELPMSKKELVLLLTTLTDSYRQNRKAELANLTQGWNGSDVRDVQKIYFFLQTFTPPHA
jgi:hypothetical protein